MTKIARIARKVTAVAEKMGKWFRKSKDEFLHEESIFSLGSSVWTLETASIAMDNLDEEEKKEEVRVTMNERWGLDTQWASYFDLSLESRLHKSLDQVIAEGTRRVVLANGWSSMTRAVVRMALVWIRDGVVYDKHTLLERITFAKTQPIPQIQLDILLGIGNCLVDPHYCEHTATAAADNAERCIRVFEMLIDRLE